ncbi:unnamed protein product [Calypogeia fissa]
MDLVLRPDAVDQLTVGPSRPRLVGLPGAQVDEAMAVLRVHVYWDCPGFRLMRRWLRAFAPVASTAQATQLWRSDTINGGALLVELV